MVFFNIFEVHKHNAITKCAIFMTLFNINIKCINDNNIIDKNYLSSYSVYANMSYRR